jgi:hypothetical protein
LQEVSVFARENVAQLDNLMDIPLERHQKFGTFLSDGWENREYMMPRKGFKGHLFVESTLLEGLLKSGGS